MKCPGDKPDDLLLIQEMPVTLWRYIFLLLASPTELTSDTGAFSDKILFNYVFSIMWHVLRLPVVS